MVRFFRLFFFSFLSFSIFLFNPNCSLNVVVVLKIYPDKNDGKADAKNKNKEIGFSNKLIIRFLVVGSMKIPRLVLITRYEGDFFFLFY